MSSNSRFGKTNVKVGEYKAIKQLLDNGLSNSQVSKLSNRSWATVQFVKDSKDFSDYKYNNKVRIAKKHDDDKPEVDKQPVEGRAEQPAGEVAYQTSSERQATALERIADVLEKLLRNV